jgi:hypothetical protein
MEHITTGMNREKLFAAVWLAADKYFSSTVSDSGYLDSVQVLEHLEPAVERLRLGDQIGLTVTADFVYVRDAPITEPWEEVRRTSTLHVEVQPNARLDAKVVLEWGWEWLPETQRKW